MTRTASQLLHIAIVLGIILDLLTVYGLMVFDSLIRWPLFATHVILALVFCALFRKLKVENFEENSNFVFVAFALTLLLPGYGVLGMFAVYLSLRYAKIKPREYFDTDEYFMPTRRSYLKSGIERDRLELKIKRNELDIAAFADILKSNDRQLEESAINKLSRQLTKNSVSILKGVLKSHTSDTRILAATALSEMEDKVLTRIDSLRAKLHRDPEDDETMLELARAYDLYCYLGVLDSVSEKYYQDLAIQHYNAFLKQDADHREANLEYGRVLLNAGKINEAIKILRLALALSPAEINPKIWLAEAYYMSADYDNVRQLCQKLTDAKELPENVKEVVSWWAPVGEKTDEA